MVSEGALDPDPLFCLENLPDILFPEQTRFLWFFYCFAGKSAKWSTLFHSKINLQVFVFFFFFVPREITQCEYRRVTLTFPQDLLPFIIVDPAVFKNDQKLQKPGFHFSSFVTS